MIAVVGFGDPGAINRAVNDFFGWAPNPPVEARMVDPAQAAELRALVAGIEEGAAVYSAMFSPCCNYSIPDGDP